VIEKLRRRTIRIGGAKDEPGVLASAESLLGDVKGIHSVNSRSPDRLIVSYNVRQITLQTIEALLREFGYTLKTGFYCRFLCIVCYYIEDIECSHPIHDQAECTRDAFITHYLNKPHGCRDQRPEYSRRIL
jgi:hypothetical protein